MKNAVVVVASLVLMGCGAATRMNPAANGKKSSSSQCKTKNDKSLDPQKQIQKQTITIKQGKQQAIYKDCDGRETHKKFEKLKEKSKVMLTLKSRGRNSQLKVVVNNRTTCDSNTFLIRKTDKIEILVAAERIAKHVRIDDTRENYLDYEVRECTNISSESHCVESQVIEQGTFVLSIKIAEHEISGAKEITVCRQPKNKQPPGSKSVPTSLP